ncbi:MAG: tRNA lysidine(34) synthetase TilS [Dehalococcoidia bacterium]
MTTPDVSVPLALPRNRRTGAFERQVARAIAPHVRAEVPLVVACSGGPDSLATLVAVARTRPAQGVTAAQFDHRLRPASEVAEERRLVQAVARAIGAGFAGGRAGRVPVDRAESAAREARYRWLARACTTVSAAACVTGHTLDDQAETVLLRLVRGTGIGGAAGMAEVSPWPIPPRGPRARSGPLLLRPLLGIGRAAVEDYLDALGLAAARDPSNDTLEYARNRVRQRVMPELRALNPRSAEQIAGFAARARADDAALGEWAAAAAAALAGPGERGPAGSIALDRGALLELPVAVAVRVVRIAAGTLGVALERGQAEATLHAAAARGRRAALGGGVEAWRDGAWLRIGRAGSGGDSARSCS